MTLTSMSRYDPNTAEKHERLWKVLNQANDREIASNYTIVLASVSNIYFDTRYHLRTANNVRITRKGPTEETVYGTQEGGTALKLKADKNFVTTYSSYKVTTNGNEDYTSFMLQYIYMGLYQETKIGLTLTTSLSKTTITLGTSLLTSIGLKLSVSITNMKLYLGAVLGAPLVRVSIQKKHSQYLATDSTIEVYKSTSAENLCRKTAILRSYKGEAMEEKYLGKLRML